MPDNSNLWSQALSDPNQAAMQPETFVNPVARHQIEHLIQLLRAPGAALHSQQPVTSDQIVKPAFEMARQLVGFRGQ